ncbi:MAG: TatD family hydrolase [Candidatus Spyradocola sp.]|nr:TatD family hydrolase [Candidatus Spyradocola sp.]
MYFDTHAHLDDEQFDADREELIERMQREGIRPCMTVGANMHMNRIAVELAQRYEGYLYAAVGLHPNDADELNDDTMAQLKEWMRLPRVRAWGEIGLDYHYEDSPSRQVQQEAFAAQLDAARQADKPVILHIREAHGDALAMLRERRGSLPRGVVHCYSGSWESAQEYLDLGFHISFTGSVTFKNAVKLAAVSDRIPLERLMIETDCPYMAPVPLRGRRNDPCNVKLIAQFLAGRRGMDVEELARVTRENGLKLFGIPELD